MMFVINFMWLLCM